MAEPATDGELDAVIVGGGPAGLTAAIFLARFRRRFALIDAGQSRASWIPTSHNHPGFPDGIAGPALLARLRAQLASHGHAPRTGTVTAASRDGDGRFRVQVDGEMLPARHLVLATGVVDVEPPLPQVLDAVRRGLVRQCPICDGYEMIDRPLIVIGRGAPGAGEALFLRTYTAAITLVTLGEPLAIPEADRARLDAAGIAVVEAAVRELSVEPGAGARVVFADGRAIEAAAIYSALGIQPRADLAATLGVMLHPDRRIATDDHQRTSIEGCYAAGDIVTGLNQIAVAMAQGEIAAVDIHNRLRVREGLRLAG